MLFRGEQVMKMKKALAILLAVCFLMSLTVTAVSAASNFADDFRQGFKDGYSKAYDQGYEFGFEDGFDSSAGNDYEKETAKESLENQDIEGSKANKQGFKAGYTRGFPKGYGDGFDAGVAFYDEVESVDSGNVDATEASDAAVKVSGAPTDAAKSEAVKGLELNKIKKFNGKTFYHRDIELSKAVKTFNFKAVNLKV